MNMKNQEINKPDQIKFLAEASRRRFINYCQLLDPDYQSSWFHEYLANFLQGVVDDVAKGIKRRVILTVPPRMGKTHTAAELWPTWALGRYPKLNFILSTYGSELSERTGLAARDLVNHPHYQAVYPGLSLRKDVKSKRKWKTNKGGGFVGTGIGGAITGIGADCILVDDPFKSREEAESITQRERVWEYFRSTLYSRLQGSGAIVLIMQRWHQDDLVGRLIEQQEEAEKSLAEGGSDKFDRWEVINFPALATKDEIIDGVLVRKEGESLWPEGYSVEDIINIRNNIGVYNFTSQYQQNPIAVENQEFNPETFRYFEDSVLDDPTFRYFTFVDPAISQKSTADNSVVTTIAKSPHSPNIYRVREDAGKFTPTQLIDLIFKHNAQYKSDVHIEAVAFQKMLSYAVDEEQRKRETYFVIKDFKPTGAKEGRVRGLIPLYDRGVIFHRRSDQDYEEELLTFPRGRRDDRIDTMASAVLGLDRTRSHHAGRVKVKRFVGYFKNR